MADPFDFDGVDSSSVGVVGSPVRQKSPARGRLVGYGCSSAGRANAGCGGLGTPASAASASKIFAPASPPPKKGNVKDALDYDGGSSDDDAGSMASSSVASSTLSFGTGSSRAGRAGGGRSKMKKKQSASAKLQSRLQQMRKREAEEEAERIVDDYASVGKRSVTSGGGGGGGSVVVGRRRKHKKSAATGTTQRRQGQQQQRSRLGPASTAETNPLSARDAADDDTNDALLEDLLDDDMDSRTSDNNDDDEECNSRAGTPKAHGSSRSGSGSGSGAIRGNVSGDRGFDGMVVDASTRNEMEPCSQSSFLSLSASPYKRSGRHMSQDTEMTGHDDDDHDNDDATSTAYSHASNASSARGGRRRIVARRGAYGSQHQSQSSTGGDFDDITSISTAGNSSIGSDAVLGGGVDVFTLQDAGTYRMLNDDCSYLCETILSSIKKDGDGTCDPIIRHTSVTADACCNLAVLFSSARNRAVLLRTAKILQSNRGSGGGVRRQGRDALDSILEAISCAPFPSSGVVVDGMEGATSAAAASTTAEETGGAVSATDGRTAKSRRGRAAAAAAAAAKAKSLSQIETSSPEGGELDPYDRVAAHSLSVLAYYLSLECSRGDRSALRDFPTAARRVRRRVLRNGPALRGVSRMVQLDPLVEAVLESNNERNVSKEVSKTELDNMDVPSVHSSRSKAMSGAKRDRENDNDDDEGSFDAEISTVRDPTKAGRRKKRGKKRRLLPGKGSNKRELEPILEDDGSLSSKKEVTASSPETGTGRENGVESTPELPEGSSATVQSSGVQSKQKKQSKEQANLDFLLSDDRSPVPHGASTSIAAKRNVVARTKPRSVQDTNVERLNQKVLKAASKLAKRTNLDDVVTLDYVPCTNLDCPCHRTSINITSKSSGHLALGALSRLLTGKDKDAGAHGDGDDGDEDERQSDDESSEGEHSDVDVSTDQNEEKNAEENNLSNPLIFTNVMLRRSGSLPHLARAVSDTFASIVCLLGDNVGKGGSSCEVSVNHLRKRASSLFSIIDGASCLSGENRKVFCQTTGGATLINNLLGLISAVPFDLEWSSAVISDITLSALRTLTSLTHENPLAAEQMLQTQKNLCWISSDDSALGTGRFSKLDSSEEADTSCLTGVGIILYNLHRMVTAQNSMSVNVGGVSNDSRDKHCYDVAIFCLNILTNVVEMASFRGARRQIYELELPNDAAISSTSLSWLASWLTDQTTSYRDAVMKGSFGDKGQSLSEGANKPRELQKDEEEYLVMAGNGFILLAYLMKADDEVDSAGDELTTNIREAILSQMPTDDKGRKIGITLMIKTLKAFCNFYHFSIGPLSVAVVTPVLKLIKDLENIQLKAQLLEACSDE